MCQLKTDLIAIAIFVRRKLGLRNDSMTPEYVEGLYNKIAVSDRSYINDYKTEDNLKTKMVNEIIDILSAFDFKSVLDVGAGELTTLLPIAKRFGKSKKYIALDLALLRLKKGKPFFEKESGLKVKTIHASAANIQLPDKSVDLVFTAHCLEAMPYDFKKAIDEMCRVSKHWVILIEPSFENGNIHEKIKILGYDYVIGIDKYIKSKKLKVKARFHLNNNTDKNYRSYCTIIDVSEDGVK